MTDDLPDFAALTRRADAPARTSWGLLGDLGTIALLTPARVREAAACIATGDVFNLDWPVNAFDPPTAATRKPAEHHIFQKRPTHRDDYLDSFYLQGTTQIDGLRHQAHADTGFYNGVSPDSLIEDGGPLGIDVWAEHGIVGRGVLLDIDRHLIAKRGAGLDHAAGESFDVGLLAEVAAAQGVELRAGDILMLRTGWAEHYFQALSDEQRAGFPRDLRCSGLRQTEEAVAWFWDARIAMVAADNIAVEVVPPQLPGISDLTPDGRLHPILIAQLGLPLGELWRLDDLADACDADGRYDMLIAASPLNVRGGVGSPANAVAIR